MIRKIGEEKKQNKVVTSTTNRLKKGEEKKKKDRRWFRYVYVCFVCFFLWGGGGEVLVPNVNITKLSWGTVRVHKCIYGVDIDFLSSHKTFLKKKRRQFFSKTAKLGVVSFNTYRNRNTCRSTESNPSTL